MLTYLRLAVCVSVGLHLVKLHLYVLINIIWWNTHQYLSSLESLPKTEIRVCLFFLKNVQAMYFLHLLYVIFTIIGYEVWFRNTVTLARLAGVGIPQPLVPCSGQITMSDKSGFFAATDFFLAQHKNANLTNLMCRLCPFFNPGLSVYAKNFSKWRDFN